MADGISIWPPLFPWPRGRGPSASSRAAPCWALRPMRPAITCSLQRRGGWRWIWGGGNGVTIASLTARRWTYNGLLRGPLLEAETRRTPADQVHTAEIVPPIFNYPRPATISPSGNADNVS